MAEQGAGGESARTDDEALAAAREASTRRAKLAQRVVELAAGLVVSDNHFLAPAIGQLTYKPSPAPLFVSFATDGTNLFVDANRLLSNFQSRRQPPTHDLAHVLMHCILMHPFVGSGLEEGPWNLACDIIAEMLVAEVCGPREGERGESIELVIETLRREQRGNLTTDRLYQAFRRGEYHDFVPTWMDIFQVDAHDLWFRKPADEQDQGGAQQQTTSSSAPNEQDDEPHQRQGQQQEQDRQGQQDAGQRLRDRLGLQDQEERQTIQTEAFLPNPTSKEREQSRARWSQVAKSINVDLHTLSRTRGSQLGDLTHELEVRTHRRQDYREFLRKFAVTQEVMHVSQDEFDYVFYTYGLHLYGNVPLIEPLEYRDERRIRDFVIVIDTSGSVEGETIQRFVDMTYDVLTSGGSFTDKVNVHIIQADAGVESDTKITSLDELRAWQHHVVVKGFGGTDFRPAFAYVDELVQKHEFDNLCGLVYFTDGWGTYPTRMPRYKTAFVFYDEDYRREVVPPWAIQLVLPPEALERESDESRVYREASGQVATQAGQGREAQR